MTICGLRHRREMPRLDFAPIELLTGDDLVQRASHAVTSQDSNNIRTVGGGMRLGWPLNVLQKFVEEGRLELRPRRGLGPHRATTHKREQRRREHSASRRTLAS